MDVSIIIVNYKTPQLTQQCIESVIEKTHRCSYEIIIVDNASGDGSADLFRATFPTAKVIECEENIGFGRANNRGYAAATGDYIFLLNSDTRLVNDAVSELFRFMRDNAIVSIAGGRLLDAEGRDTHSFGAFLPSPRKEIEEILRGVGIDSDELRIRRQAARQGYAKVAYITGADMMLRRRLIEQVGLFDEDFFMYYEEAEMTYRYTRRQLYSYYLPAAKITHLEGKSTTLNKRRTDMQIESRRKYFHKCQSQGTLILCDIILSIGLLVKILMLLINGKNAENSLYRLKKTWA